MKKSFLTSLSVLAATMASDASAAMPQSVTERMPEVSSTIEQSYLANSPFVLDKPNDNGGLFVAYHSSHASHASHASHSSHFSSRY